MEKAIGCFWWILFYKENVVVQIGSCDIIEWDKLKVVEGTDIVTFNSDLHKQVDDFFEKCFFAVGIPYSPKDRHADVANVQQHYMNNGCFWCLLDDNKIMTRLKSSEEDDLGANKLFEILVPNTELETAQDIIFDSELDRWKV